MAREKKPKKVQLKKNSAPKADVQKEQSNIELDALAVFAQALIIKLSEHCDTCQVICTKLEPNGYTSMVHVGSGNVYARKASMECVIDRWAEAGAI